jgi:uncharacterized protein (TIGR03067 family)
MTTLLSLLFIVIGYPGYRDDGEAKQALAKLQGTWKVVSSVQEGEEVPTKDDVKWTYIVKGEELIAGDNPKEVVKFKLLPGQIPAAVDLTEAKTNQVSLGIYHLDGDTLKLCFNQPGEKRPTAFASPKGSGTILFVMKREKK